MRSDNGILILSAGAGTGHIRAGEAVEEAIRARAPARRVEHVDVLELAPDWVATAYGDGFEFLAARAPEVWRRIYELSDGPDDGQTRLWSMAARVLFRQFRRKLRDGPWGRCVCTHFLPGQLVAGRPGFPPLSMVITDYQLHRYWVQPGIDRYYVPTDAMASALRSRLPGTPVHATGVPLRTGFRARPLRGEARRELGLPRDRPVLLVLSGGMGLDVAERAEAALDAPVEDLLVVAICGRNRSARESLEALGVPDGRLRVHGYVRRMERFMAAADLILTKPGGLTVSEALAVGRPMLLTRPIPGHEEGNAEEVSRAGAAVAVDGASEITRAVADLLGDPGRLEKLADRAAALGKPDASDEVAAAELGERRIAAVA